MEYRSYKISTSGRLYGAAIEVVFSCDKEAIDYAAGITKPGITTEIWKGKERLRVVGDTDFTLSYRAT